MTQEPQKPEVIDIVLSFDDKAKATLSRQDYQTVTSYIANKGPELALVTANRFFELYLNGNTIDEIQSLNPSFHRECIQWAKVKYDWDKAREDYVNRLQSGVVEKVLKAQLEATSLYADIISVTVKKHGNKYKKYLQTGEMKDLEGAIQIDSIAGLGKVIEGLQKITGQDRQHKITKEETTTVTIKAEMNDSGLSPEAAAEVLKIIAEEKRKNERQKLITGEVSNEKAKSDESGRPDESRAPEHEEGEDETEETEA